MFYAKTLKSLAQNQLWGHEIAYLGVGRQDNNFRVDPAHAQKENLPIQ